MPIAHVKSLLKLSLVCIVNKIGFSYPPVKLSTDNDVISESKRPESDINPFHQLPTSLLELIIRNISYLSYVLTKEAKVCSVLEYLISPQLRITHFFHYTEEYNLNIFPQFGKLLSLNLSSTPAGDKCLEVIGTYCKNLRILNVIKCRNVTDAGVRLLCFSCEGNGKENQRLNDLCMTLQHFHIHSTNVTKQGVQLVINHLTKLKLLNHATIFEVLFESIQTGLVQNLPKIQNFSLNSLLVDNNTYRRGSLGQVLQFCPSLNFAHIVAVKGLTDTDLLSLMSLKNLVRFDLRHPSGTRIHPRKFKITFEGGVVPLLQKFGKSLEVLDISFFLLGDIWTILKFCPHLTSLTLNPHPESVTALCESELILYRNERERFILKNLEILHCGYQTSPEILHFLWSFPLLKEIYIFSCNTLTDEFLQNAFRCRKFPNLKKLDFQYCDFVSKQGIDALMTHRNCIEELRFNFCQNLTVDNVYDWYMQAKRNQWKFYIYFKNYDIEECYSSDEYLSCV